MDNYNLKKIGENIKNQRLAAGYTLNYVGANVGVLGKQVCDWERGKSIPPVKRIIKICNLFDCGLTDIIDIPDGPRASYKNICDKLGIDGKSLKLLRTIANLYSNDELYKAFQLLIELKEVQNG